MPDIPGKNVRIYIEDSEGAGTFSPLAKATTDGWTINNTEVEVSHKDALGWRGLFPEGAIKSISGTVGFIFDDTAAQRRLEAVALSTVDPSALFQLRDGAGQMLQGRFQVSSFELGGETEGFPSATGTLASDGVIQQLPVP